MLRRTTTVLTALVAGVGLAIMPAGDADAALTFTVSTTDDGGDINLADSVCDASPVVGLQCTFRAALEQANASPGADTVNFNVPLGSGVATIGPRSPLPAITDTVEINGYSQAGAAPNTRATGNDAVLKVELSGARAGTGADGLVVLADGCTIKGLAIGRFGGDGIVVDGTGNRIEGDFIGTRASGTADAGNGGSGVHITGPSNSVGAPPREARNLLSGNDDFGVLVEFADSTGNHIENSYIGTNKAGTAAIANQSGGVLALADDTIVGGTRNLVSGNGSDGISLVFADQAVVAGNLVGTDVTGTTAIANDGTGVDTFAGAGVLIGGTTARARNVVSGNTQDGISASGNGVAIQNNLVGTDVTGRAALGNGGSGVRLNTGPITVGGTQAGARNVISANGVHGVFAVGSSNTIAGNFIGTDVTGEVDLGNVTAGVEVTFGGGTVIGGTVAAARNLISGNFRGIELFGQESTGNVVQGNAIGVSASNGPLSNGVGIYLVATTGNTIGGAGSAGNAVSRNSVGIQLDDADGNQITGNAITANTFDGITIDGNDNTIGGGNVIVANGGDGVSVRSGTGNRIVSNQLLANTHLAIDLLGGSEDSFGVTADDPDDPDTGPNHLQNFPVITSAIRSNTTSLTTIAGTLDSTASTPFTIQCFLAEGDPSGHGEAQVLLASRTITTNSSGNGSFACVVPGLSPGLRVSVVAIDDDTNDTSELSLNATVVAGP